MATPALIVVIVAAIVSLSVLTVTILLVATQVRQLVTTLGRVQQELDPHLANLSAGTEETQRRLERVSEAGETLGDRRTGH